MSFLSVLLSKISYIIPIVVTIISGILYFKGKQAAKKQYDFDANKELNKLQEQQIEAINLGELVKERVDDVKKNLNSSSSDAEFSRLLSTDPTKDPTTK